MTIQQPNSFRNGPDERGHFGIYGGRFVAETLMPLILELEHAYAVAKAGETLGWPLFIGGLIGLVAAVIWFRVARAKSLEADRVRQIEERRAALLQKYGDPQVVERIMGREVWQGQSAEQLRDSRGQPLDWDERVSKKSIRHVWKYEQRGVSRFALRITLENGFVTGWDDKT